MGKLVVIVGNTGVGKTTLTRALCQAGSFVAGLEEHIERPFQALFKQENHYALANQLDYFLLRAEQEIMIRRAPQTGIQDGGLEMDFYVFTRLFHHKGYLSDAEYNLCERLHALIRTTLPPPDMLVRLTATQEEITRRFAKRERSLEIAVLDDLELTESFLEDWFARNDPAQIISLDTTADDINYSHSIPLLLEHIQALT